MLDAFSLDQFLKRYARRLAARWGGAGEDEIRLLVPLSGVMSIVRLVEVGGRPRAVIRVYETRSAAELDRRMLADLLVRHHRLDAPLVLDVAESNRLGAIALAETFAPGEHPRPEAMDGPRIKALALTLARLHNVTRDAFGDIGRPESGDFVGYAIGRVANRFRSVGRWAPPGIKAESRRRVRAWFDARAPQAAQPEGYSLIHDKPNRGNLIYQSDCGRFVFVDLATMQFGAPAKDIVQVCHEVLGNEPPAVEDFLAAYFTLRGGDTERERYDARRPFWHAYYHLSQCAINCRRRHKSGDEGGEGDNFALKAVNNWNNLLRIVDHA